MVKGTPLNVTLYVHCLFDSIRLWKNGIVSITGLLLLNLEMQLLRRRSSPHEHHSHTSMQAAISVFHVLNTGYFTVTSFPEFICWTQKVKLHNLPYALRIMPDISVIAKRFN